MAKIDELLTSSRNQLLEESDPGTQAVAQVRGAQEAERLAPQLAKADDDWRKLADPGKISWGKDDYRYRDAHCAGINLETGDLPNRYFAANARNAGGYDLSSGAPVKPVVDRQYEGNAYYGAGELSRSRTTIGGVKPPEDIVGLSSFAAAYQGSGRKYEDFVADFRDYSDPQLAKSWQAGTDSLRLQELQKNFTFHDNRFGDTNYSAAVGLYQPDPKKMDFDVRMADAKFQKLGRTIYKHMNGGAEFKGNDVESARWLADHMRDIDFLTPLWPLIALRAKNGTPETWQAYAQALEAWDMTNMELAFLPQFKNTLRVFASPDTYLGMGIGKVALTSAGRIAFKEFMQRLAVGAATGAVMGTAQATLKAGTQGRDPTGGELASSAISQGLAMGAGNAIIPPALTYLGRKIVSGVNAFKSRNMPEMPGTAVVPRGVGMPLEGEYIPAGSGPVGEISLPRRAGDQPVRTTPEPVNLEQQPFEREIEPPEGHGMGPAMGPDAEARAQTHAFLASQDTGAAEDAAAALPVQLARPTPPRDPGSRVMIDPATGYYSPIQKTVAESPHAVQQPAQWMADIKRSPLLKQDELEWLDLEKFFKGKTSVTKEELLAHIDENLVKIQRHLLVPQRRNTMPWSVHVAKTNPKYAELLFEAESIEQEMYLVSEAHFVASQEADSLGRELDEKLRVTADIAMDDPRYPGLLENLQQHRDRLNEALRRRDKLEDVSAQSARLAELNDQMRRIAGEERKLMLASGETPPGVHDIEYMLTETGTDGGHRATDILDSIYKFLMDAQKAEQTLARARTDAGRKQAQARISGSQELIRSNWGMLEDLADEMGAIVRPQDLDRVYGMINYGDPQVRDYSILGANMAGMRLTRHGADPIAHQIALFRHPEGLQASGMGGHPGGDTPGTLGWAITSERNLADGSTTTFVDEVQSDITKERRRGEKQYREMKPAVDADPELDFDGANALRFAEDYDDYVYQQYRDSFNLNKTIEKRRFDRLPEHWRDTTPAQRQAMLQKPIWGLGVLPDEDVPAMPKQIFYSTAQASMLKSELYNAALSGKDNFSWATSGIIQDRYGQRPQTIQGEVLVEPHIDKIRFRAGNARFYVDFARAYELADKMDPDNGAAMRKLVHEMKRFSQGGRDNQPSEIGLFFDKPFTWKPGAYWAYDVQIKKELEKMAAKYGGKVELVDMPVAPGSGDTVKVWNIKLTPELKKKLLERGVPFGVAGAAVMAGQQEEETQ